MLRQLRNDQSLGSSSAHRANRSMCEIREDTPKEKVRVKLFPVLLNHVMELKKLLEMMYKGFVQALMDVNPAYKTKNVFERVNTKFVAVEKAINDCNRKCYDMIDLFEDLGVNT